MIDSEWFKGKLADRELSQADLARALGVNRTQITMLLQGKRDMKVSEVPIIAALLGVDQLKVLKRANGEK